MPGTLSKRCFLAGLQRGMGLQMGFDRRLDFALGAFQTEQDGCQAGRYDAGCPGLQRQRRLPIAFLLQHDVQIILALQQALQLAVGARRRLPGRQRLGRAVAGQDPGILPVGLGAPALAVGPVVHPQRILQAYLPTLGGGKARQGQLIPTGKLQHHHHAGRELLVQGGPRPPAPLLKTGRRVGKLAPGFRGGPLGLPPQSWLWPHRSRHTSCPWLPPATKGRIDRVGRAPEVPKRPDMRPAVAQVSLRRLRQFDLSSHERCARRGRLRSGARWGGD